MDQYPLIQKRSFALKGASSPTKNTIAGAASVLGVMDRSWWNDVICPGAFTRAIAAFRANGFVAVGHAWDELPVAMPTVCEERGNQLYCEAEFHTTQDAIDARTICEERMAKGLSVGLSVGFRIADDGCARFEKGSDLIAWAVGKGYDMSLFDVAGISAHDGECRAIAEISDLFEYSIVTVPANPSALATSMKDFKPRVLTLADDLDAALGAVARVTDRLESLKATRDSEGKRVSAERLAQATELVTRLQSLTAEPAKDGHDIECRQIKDLIFRDLALKTALLAG